MYSLSEKEIDFILNDIKKNGVELEDLQLNLLDHICCIFENEYNQDENFEIFYQKTVSKFFKKELREIEEETQLLLTFKNYYAMKKTMIVSGATSVGFLLLGSLFKLMHWPGASALLVVGFACICFLFMPLLFITKSREAESSRDKIVLGLGLLVGILYCMSTLFKVMHWPGSTALWVATIVLSAFLFIPIYFFTGIRNPDTKTNTIVTSILLVGATSVLFMLLNLRPSKKAVQLKMHNYLQSEELLSRLKTKQFPTQTPEKAQLLSEINACCEQIKELIFESSIGRKNISKNFESEHILLEDRLLGAEFYDDKGEGAKLILRLNGLLDKYNSSASSKIPNDHSALNDGLGNMADYNVYSVLNSLLQVQYYVISLGA